MADDSADDRWTVRGVPKATKDAAASAAQRRKVSVGAVLCLAVDALLREEREPMDLLPPRSTADNPADMSDIERIERVVNAAVTLAGAADVPKMLRGRANRLLREALPAPVERVKGSRRQIANASPTIVISASANH